MKFGGIVIRALLSIKEEAKILPKPGLPFSVNDLDGIATIGNDKCTSREHGV